MGSHLLTELQQLHHITTTDAQRQSVSSFAVALRSSLFHCNAGTLLQSAKTPFTRYNRLLNRLYDRLNWLYNRFDNRFDNGFDNRVERTGTVHSTSCQTGLYSRFDNRLYTRYSRLSNQLSNQFDNWFDNGYRVYKHLPGYRLYHVNGALEISSS